MSTDFADRIARVFRPLVNAMVQLAEIAAMQSHSIGSDSIDSSAIDFTDRDYCRDCDAPEGMDW
jgi:hypothetical protein